jgi:hypothetical protein
MKQQLMLVAMLSVGTALTTMGRLKPVAASLTPPTSYDYSYIWNATDSEQYLNANGVDSILLYTRTSDGAYYNYTNTTNIIDGLIVTQIFNRSNTTWQLSGTFYKPDENKIGSNSSVGSASKTDIVFTNNTNKDYKLFLDLSSSTASTPYFLHYFNGDLYGQYLTDNIRLYTANLLEFIIPSYFNVRLQSANTTSDQYLDAWYLQDLGISDSYQAGLDAETDGILTDYLGTDAQQIGWVLIGIAAILFAFKGGK